MAEQFSDRVDILDGDGRAVFQFDARFAVLDLGAQGNEGDLRLRGNDGNFTFHFDGGRSLLTIRDAGGRDVFHFDGSAAVLDLGARGNEGDLRIRGNDGSFAIHLDGGAGDIKLLGADCAEEFELDDEPEGGEPGAVLVIAGPGGLRRCSEPYDKRVAGVISGAGDYRPGIILDRQHERGGRTPVALTGKVYCRVDAQYAPVEVGDLLTTSPTIGHAMKACDRFRSFGAILGKSLQPLPRGRGLVPILVALQ